MQIATASKRCVFTAAALAASCGISVAATLDIDGNFGNTLGCDYLKTGQLVSDEMLYLTPEKLSNYAYTCGYDRIVSSQNGTLVVEGTCREEGVEEKIKARMTITPAESGRYKVSFGEDISWEPLPKCP